VWIGGIIGRRLKKIWKWLCLPTSLKATNRAREPIKEYIAALHEVYPRARGNTSVTVRPNYAVIVHVPLPKRASERMRLFDQMAEVGTRLLLETDEYIILSGR
jgi:hypothetical protein